MASRSFPPSLAGGRRLVAAIAVVGVAAGLVTIPGATPTANAAFQGLPWQTNFEIEPFPTANQVRNGPIPPAGGAGIDWDNAASFIQDFGNPTEFCGNGVDPTSISGKLDDFNLFAPNPVPGLVLNKGDICQAFSGWEIVNVTTGVAPAPVVTELHYILYGGFRREQVAGEISVYFPLIGGPAREQVTLVKFNYDSAAGGRTGVTQLDWNGSTWLETALAPTTAFNSSVNAAQSPSFGEFAVDLTATGILPSAPAACDSFVLPYVFTQTGNAASAELKDILDVPNVEISNCSQVQITKVTNPPAPDPPATFLYDLDQVDGGPVQDATPPLPPNEDANPSPSVLRGSLTVPGSPTDDPTNIIAATGYRLLEVLPPPAPWSHVSVVCNYFNPLVLDANLKATPAPPVTLTNPDGTWNNQTFAVAPPGLLPDGVSVAASCTITNQAPSLTLVKQVVNEVRGPLATPDMWLLSASGPGPTVVDYGPGTAAGVSRVVAPGTYTLAETRNTAPAPPIDYTDGTTWTCNGVNVGNQVTLGAADNVTCTITNTANPAQLTLQKLVNNTAGGTATVGNFTLTATFATPGDPGSVDGLPIAGVTGVPSVTDRLVKRGGFTLSETEIPGYAASWVCVDATGATISTSNSVVVPVDITNLGQLDVTCTVTNTFAALDIGISGAAINPVGVQHTFTLTATSSTDGVNFTPLAGALLDLDVTTGSGLDLGDVTIVSDTCQSAPGTDANGQCTVIVNSSASGVLNVIANGFTNQGPNGPNPGQPFVLSSPVSSSKSWLEFRVEGAASDINLVGEPHTFTLSGTQIAGPNESPLAGGALITFTWDGPGTPTGPTVAVAPGGGFQCIVGADGTCAVTVTSGTPASGTLTVTGIVVTLLNGQTPGSTTTYTLTYPNVALQEPAPEVTKTWAAFEVTVSPSAVNLIRQPHPFIISVTQDLGSGPEPVADGTIVDYDWDGDGVPVPAASCVTAGGECTVTVTSDAPGAGTLTVVGLRDVPVDDGVTSTIIENVTVDASGALAVPAPVEKRWVLIDVAITAGADNLAGESHTFTVQVTASDGDGGFPDGGVPGAIVDASVVTIVGDAALTTDGTCDEGTNATGQCTLIVTNPTSGSIVVQLEQVAVTVNGQLFVIDLTPSLLPPGLRADAILPIQSEKVWWQYRVILSDSSTNPLGLIHTFTATVQRTSDGGATWVPVPDGAFLDHAWSDPFSVSSLSTTESTCLTTGTVAGACTFVVSSTAPTIGTLTISGIRDTWLDRNRDGDAGRPGDLTPDPVELAQEIVDIPASAFGTGSILTASKTWWDFTVDVDGLAENPVGDDHTFNLIVQFSDGFGFQPVSPGTTLTYTWTGPAGSAEDTAESTCDPTNGPGTDPTGECTVVIGTPTVPGTGTLTITGINSTTIPQPTRTISFTFDEPGTAQKTWIAYRALISPDETNLAGEPHTFTLTVQQDRGDGAGFVVVPDGTTLAVTLSDPATLVSDSCATGTVGGTCTIVVDSADPGSVIVTPGAITVQLLNGLGDVIPIRVPVTVEPDSPAYAAPDSATKTWVGFRLGVAQTATNLAGAPHTFTVTAEFSVAPGVFQPLTTGLVDFTWSGDGAVQTPSSTCPILGAAGTCTVIVNDPNPGVGTLTLNGLLTATVTVGGTPTTFTNVNSTTTPNAIEFTSQTATKTWIAYFVTITPSANNPVGTQHDFVITADVGVGNAGPVPAAGVSIAFIWTGAGSLVTTSPCVTDVAGTCTVSVTSPSAGSGVLQVLSLTDSDGRVVDVTVVGSPGLSLDQQVPLLASKTWLQYRVLLSPDATNLVGVPHTFTATVQQTGAANPTEPDWTAVPLGTTLTATPSGPGTLDPASSCLTQGTVLGTCQFIVTDAGPGTLTLDVTAIGATTVDGVPFTNIGLSAPATATKTWVSAAVTVTPPAETNLVGESHTFTVGVNVLGEDGTPTPLPAADGATVTWTFDGPGTLNATATTCDDVGTTDGTCDIVFTNTDAGAGTLTITSVTFTANGETFTVGLTVAEPGQATPPPITATKSWVAYTVTVSPSATNPAGTPHTFTITATRSDGDPVGGATVAYTWAGAGTATPPTSCTTDPVGVCTVTVTSPGSGSGTLTVTTITDGLFVVDLTVAGVDGQSPQQVVPLTASKTWRAYRVSLSAPATNLVGVPHTFTATTQQTDVANPTESDWVAVPDGTTLTATSTGPGTIDPASTCTTPGTTTGTCTFVVNDAGPGTLTLTVTAIAGTTIGITPYTDLTLIAPASSTKTWVGYTVTISPSAVNPIGAPHTFTITATRTDGDPVGAATIAYTWSGTESPTPPSPCTTNATGVCTVTVTSPAAGGGTLTVTTLTDGPFTVDLTAGGPTVGRAPSQTVPVSASKTWQAYRVLLSAAATNLVGVPHTFTATVQQTAVADPAETDWVAVPDGTTLTATTSGSGAIDTAASTCATTGTVAGTCTYVVNDAGAGTLTLTVTAIAATTIGETTVTDLPVPSAETTKTWVAYTVTISPSATNPAGAAHTFTITATRSDGDPVGGATVAYTWAGTGTATPPDSCTTDAAGQCTVSVTSPASGTGTLTVTTLTDGLFVVDLTAGGPTVGRAPEQVVPLTASKTWRAYRVQLSGSATNLVGVPHTFTATVQQTDIASPTEQDWVAVPDDTTLTANTAGPGAIDTAASTCANGGTTGGTCTFVVTDAGAGTLTLTVTEVEFTTIGATEVEAQPVPPVSTTKTWVAYTVTISPSATNRVGDPHPFTITATRSDGDPVDGATIAYTWAGTGTATPPTSCTTDPVGVCTVSVTSNDPGTGTLTVTTLTDGLFVVDLTAGGPTEGRAPEQVVPLTSSKTWLPAWKVTIVKASSVTGSAQTFAFETTGFLPPDDQPFELAIGGEPRVFTVFLPGVYTIEELVDAASLPAPWRFESVACTGVEGESTATIDGAQVELDLAEGEPGTEITCTFTNERVNLVVDKDDSGATAVGGGPPFNYTIAVRNAGSVATTAPITVTDTLPVGLSFAGVPTVPTGTSCNAPAGNTLTCTITSSISPGGSVQLVVPVRAAIGAPSPALNSVTIDSSEDPLCPNGQCPPPPPQCVPAPAGGAALLALGGGDPTDNRDCESTPVVGTALGVVKSDGGLTATAGGTYTYSITVWNIGPATATGVTVTDALPAELAVVGTPTGDGWVCSVSGRDADGFGGTITCTRAEPLLASGANPAGGAPPIMVEVRLRDGFTGTVTNTARVSSAEVSIAVVSTDTTPVQNTATPAPAPDETSSFLPFTGGRRGMLFAVGSLALVIGLALCCIGRRIGRRERVARV